MRGHVVERTARAETTAHCPLPTAYRRLAHSLHPHPFVRVPAGHVGDDHLLAGLEPAEDLDGVHRRPAQPDVDPHGLGAVAHQPEQADARCSPGRTPAGRRGARCPAARPGWCRRPTGRAAPRAGSSPSSDTSTVTVPFCTAGSIRAPDPWPGRCGCRWWPAGPSPRPSPGSRECAGRPSACPARRCRASVAPDWAHWPTSSGSSWRMPSAPALTSIERTRNRWKLVTSRSRPTCSLCKASCESAAPTMTARRCSSTW